MVLKKRCTEQKKELTTFYYVIILAEEEVVGSLYGHFAPKSFRHGYLAPYFRTRNIIFEACLF